MSPFFQFSIRKLLVERACQVSYSSHVLLIRNEVKGKSIFNTCSFPPKRRSSDVYLLSWLSARLLICNAPILSDHIFSEGVILTGGPCTARQSQVSPSPKLCFSFLSFSL